MYILGISALYHDAAAALIQDGRIIAAAQEERFTRKKQDASFPVQAIRYCMTEGKITEQDLECVVYYENPGLVVNRFVDNLKWLGKEARPLIDRSMPPLTSQRLWIHKLVERELGGLGKRGKLLIAEHHLSHAASAFYPSPFEKAVILTLDGVGEWATTTIGIGDGNQVELKEEMRYPDSIGLFHGRMEYGPRALGNRSIIADPRSEEMQSKLNLKIKYRESFRPFAPSVLLEREADYFELEKESPYMLLVDTVKKEKQISYDLEKILAEEKDNLLAVVNQKRSDIPAVTHIDYSARIQTVTREKNEYYYEVIKAFERKTGCGVLVNTSFNVRGEPIVCTPKEAYECFMRTEMDVLVLENCVLLKEKQPRFHESEDWREKYELD